MDIKVAGPEWANGCEACRFGIVFAPKLTGAASLYIERAVQAHYELIAFCDCRAGLLQRQHLRRVWGTLALHPAIVRTIVEAGNVGPTVRWAGEPAEQERVMA